jgi:hypothetical protein
MDIMVSTTPEVLAVEVVSSGLSHDDLIRFIVAIDEEVGEESFTVDLRDALNEAVNAEGGE